MFTKEEYNNFLNELNDVYEGLIERVNLEEMAGELSDIIFDTNKSLEEVFGVVMRYENQNCEGFESFVLSLVISNLPESENQVLRAYNFLLGFHDFNLFLFVMFNKKYLQQDKVNDLVKKMQKVFDKQLLIDYGFIDN